MSSAEWRPWIVVVGGFLGAGKTSLIIAACKVLKERGIRSAAVLNDQGVDLVDTGLMKRNGIAAAEVTGGCFCCRFTDLLSALAELRHHQPEVIFAEPVGSCTDLVATVLRPLREDFEHCRLAPLTVLVDPVRLAELRNGRGNSDIAYLMDKQLREADLVCLTKSDLHPEASFPELSALRVSVKTGAGIEDWLDHVLSGRAAGVHALEIDYDRYAQAEASLAWLNASLRLEASEALSPASLVGPLLDRLDEALNQVGISIAHLKLIDHSPAGWVKAALCANGADPDIDGDLDADPACDHELNLNLRALGSPDRLRGIVGNELRSLPAKILEWRMSCFSPSPPVPERRVAAPRVSSD